MHEQFQRSLCSCTCLLQAAWTQVIQTVRCTCQCLEAHLADVAQQQPHKVVPAPAPEHLVVQEIMGQPPCRDTSSCEHNLPHTAAAGCLSLETVWRI